MSRSALRFDRYLLRRQGLVDLASGARVRCCWQRGNERLPIFATRGHHVLIDADDGRRGRAEIWERSWGGPRATNCESERWLVEAMATARHGAPRVIALAPSRPAAVAWHVRHLARMARLRGWVPIALSQLLAIAGPAPRQRRPAWLHLRSLVIFADRASAHTTALDRLVTMMAGDAMPHLVVHWPVTRRHAALVRPAWWLDPPPSPGLAWPPAMREQVTPYTASPAHASLLGPSAADEARARWPVLLAETTAARGTLAPSSLALARVLVEAEQRFEARGLLARAATSLDLQHGRGELVATIERTTRAAAAAALARTIAIGHSTTAERERMVDDFVGVLQLCQEVEDERVALSRVGAYLRERLQAASVAFVVREGPGVRTIACAGLDQTCLDAALTAIESGCAVAGHEGDGPTESAAPVRYAADVIGALWARWAAGMPVSRPDAAALLGVAAVAAAPSLRGVLDRERPTPDAVVPELIGTSPAIGAVREAVVRAARSPFPVLIEGESGVGKELVARAIHAGGARRDRRFSAINCAALVDDLVEAELFGHARGAFTGAQAERPGLFEEASGGTLFLDEVAELGSRVQAKLLRTLQEGEVRRIGESQTRRVDVRIVAATNRPLAGEVAAGRFRRDLWYRLDVVRIAIPPVRERLDDIPLLVRHAWADLAARTGSRAVLSTAAVAALGSYDWPGNVRELQNVLASILVSAPRRGLLGPSMLPAHVTRAAALAPARTLDVARRQFETRFVRAALARANGRTAIAARELGLSRQGLAKVLIRLSLSGPDPPSGPSVD